jgi:hypothetical protein
MRYCEAGPAIASSPEAVRSVWADGAAWPSWDSGAGGVDGRIAPGGVARGLERRAGAGH